LPSEGVPCVVATLPGQLTGSPFPYETKQETGPFSVELFWILSEGGSKYTASGRLSFEMKTGLYVINTRRIESELEFFAFAEADRREVACIRVSVMKEAEHK